MRTAGLDTDALLEEEIEVATDGDCPMSEVRSSSSSSSKGFKSGVPIFPVKMSSTVRARSLPVSSLLLCAIGTCLASSIGDLLVFEIGFALIMCVPVSLDLLVDL